MIIIIIFDSVTTMTQSQKQVRQNLRVRLGIKQLRPNTKQCLRDLIGLSLVSEGVYGEPAEIKLFTEATVRNA